ncbi:hypothetical protein BDM02DRAFT_3185042 [Thelephora ganbajun]|uniref:Uncharacterized protein n=1 Tax=Thelephora ganbajun TaxID=370292 RepID=A0ACB6ZMS8_THEGA|nr:hypothetical protein BDM02DRAFT_3185042 [Thelephora ganbajun]
MPNTDPSFAEAVYRRLLENITEYLSDPQVQKFLSGTCIPQRRYSQGATIPGGVADRRIMFAMADGTCFPAQLALVGQCDRLLDGNGVVFTERNQTINLRIEWPGYEGWGAQIRTVNYQEEPMGITRARLVREIAKQLERFIERMRNVAIIDSADARYKVGPGGIELHHIHIASLEQVSRGSWQPRFVYNGP